jgi:hypothetical protein
MKLLSLETGPRVQDNAGHELLVESLALEDEVGVGAVEGQAFGIEVGHGLPGTADQTPGVQVSKTGQEICQGEVEEDDGAKRLQVPHGGCTIDDAAAGGDDLAGAVQGEDETLFRGSQAKVAVLVHDLLEGAPLPGLEEEIGVQKAEIGVLGQQHPDGAFADAGHTDEDEVGEGWQNYMSK